MNKNITRETFVRKFFKDNNLPFPVARENMLPYYSTIKGFEWVTDEFQKYITKIETVGFSDYIEDKDNLEEKLLNTIKDNTRYKEFLKEPIQQLTLPIDVSRNLYTEINCGLSLLSIDMRNANFTMLNKLGVVNTDDWSTWVNKFTQNQELIHSKRLRQIILGKLNNKRLEHLMRNEMIKSANKVKDILPFERIVTFNKDEIVYNVTDLDIDINTILSNFVHCKAEEFKLKRLTHGFVKLYTDGSYSFHSLPKKYWLQTYKEYMNLPTQQEDFLFLDEDRNLCLRLE